MTEQITQFPPAVVTATPVELYAEVVNRQIRGHRQRIYTPGPITSGWAVNFAPDIPTTIQLNGEFALAFAASELLSKHQPLTLPNTDRTQLADTHATVPHALGKCVFPTTAETTKKWGEFEYYIVWLMTVTGLDPSLATTFAKALAEGVDLAVVSNAHPDNRVARSQQVQRVHTNAVRFMRSHANRLKPVTALVALPEVTKSLQTTSIGTQLEVQFARSLGIPTYQAHLNAPNITETRTSPHTAWDSLVGQWLLQAYADFPAPHSSAAIYLEPYHYQTTWNA